MSRLVLTYRHDSDPSDSFGWLGLLVETEKFKGEGGFWVQWQDLVEFADTLPVSPSRLEGVVAAQWGYEMQQDDDLIVRMAVAPHGNLGELMASVELADLNAQANRVRVSFKTTYAALDWFKRDVGRLMAKEIDRAELLGRETT